MDRATDMHTTHLTTLALATLLLVPACKKDQTADPDLQTPETKSEPADPDADSESESADVNVDDRILELCEIPTPQFKFNSSKIDKQASKALQQLAACFVDGKAKGERMAIVGHTDPRGEDDYNLALGERRADSVAKYLGKKGLNKGRIDVSSRGEMDASGNEESGWARDRRVDIRLAGR